MAKRTPETYALDLRLPPAEAVDAVAAEHLPALIAQLSALVLRAAARLPVTHQHRDGPDKDRLLTVDEAAELLATTPDWLRRHRGLPFRVEVSPGQVRYSHVGLTRWIEQRAGPG